VRVAVAVAVRVTRTVTTAVVPVAESRSMIGARGAGHGVHHEEDP
jgi:hypothetical protein